MKKAHTSIVRGVLLCLAAAVLAGASAAIAFHYYQAYELSENRAAEEAGRAEQTIRDLEERLDRAEDTIVRLQKGDQPEPSQEPGSPAEPEPSDEPEPSEDPFQPDHPYYEDLYPDFYAPQPLDASNVYPGVIYLTFDDGPSNRTDEVLAILAKENVKATFFVVGQSSEANLQRMRDIVEQGHTIGMHSYSHSYTKIYTSVEAFLDDMYQIFVQIRDTTGVTPTFFRFPGGSLNSYNYGIYQDIMAEMLRRGFVPCDWNMSAQDATAKPLPVADIIANVLSTANRTRGIVLMHDSAARTTTPQALPELIRELRERGFTFAPLTPDVTPTLFGYRAIQ